jgi:hypothetical protein
MTSPFVVLPPAVRRLLGPLDEGWDDEARADCGRCPQVAATAAGAPYPFGMAADARCCTAQPNLANFLVGRAVADGAEARIRARLADRDGVSAWGIRAVAGYDEAFPRRAATGFGRDLAMRCPFWVGGDHACGVWSGRSARCRAFFCRHDHGLTSALGWSQAAGLAVALEAATADHLIEALGGGPAATAGDDELLAWYARCAAAAPALDEAAAIAIAARLPGGAAGVTPTARLQGSPRGQLLIALRRHRPPMPEVLVPAISEVLPLGDDVLLAGYSTFDAVRAPKTIFAFLARLDGTAPWRDALAAAAVPGVDAALVAELRRIGALRDPAGGDDPPLPTP